MNQLVLWTAVFTVVAYFVCAVPFGLLVATVMGHVDVRQVGSGNIGTTNVARSVGKGAAALTLLLDVAKGLASMVLARYAIAALALSGDVAALDHTTVFGTAMSVVFMGCVLGHIFTPYLGFHGGKGIAVGLGGALGLYWPVGACALALFIVLAVPTRLVSLGSVAAAASLPVWCAVFGFPAESIVPVTVVAVVVIWSHRENVGRLLHGKERRFAFHKSSGDESGSEGR